MYFLAVSCALNHPEAIAPQCGRAITTRGARLRLQAHLRRMSLSPECMKRKQQLKAVLRESLRYPTHIIVSECGVKWVDPW